MKTNWNPTKSTKVRNVLLVFLGVIALILKRQYTGSAEELVHNYGGNLAASFAVYFIITFLPLRHRFKTVMTAGLALTIVELFEALNGFGIMTNVYDPIDFAANAIGVALALLVDITLSRLNLRPPSAKL